MTLTIDFNAPPVGERPPAVRHSKTSQKAADAFHVRSASLKAQVEQWFRDNGPATDEQLAEAFPKHKDSTPRARRVELTHTVDKKGQPCTPKLRDSGRMAKTRAGRDAVLWEIIPE